MLPGAQQDRTSFGPHRGTCLQVSLGRAKECLASLSKIFKKGREGSPGSETLPRSAWTEGQGLYSEVPGNSFAWQDYQQPNVFSLIKLRQLSAKLPNKEENLPPEPSRFVCHCSPLPIFFIIIININIIKLC